MKALLRNSVKNIYPFQSLGWGKVSINLVPPLCHLSCISAFRKTSLPQISMASHNLVVIPCRPCHHSESEDEPSSSAIFSPEMMDPNSEVEMEDILSHLKIDLYPDDNDPLLRKIYEAASIQQMFDLLEETGPLSLKHQSQALVSLWDLQKFLYKLNIFFDPEKELIYKTSFVAEIRSHPTFISKVLNPVIQNIDKLDDTPLVASLLCLQRMNYDVRTTGLPFINECLKRKQTLTLPALSRLSVCLRAENTFGFLILSEFLPLTESYLKTVDQDLDIRLLTITLRSCQKTIGSELVSMYRQKINEVLDTTTLETVTLCKIMLFLLETRHNKNTQLQVPLVRKVGSKLVNKVSEMQIMDILSMQRFIEVGGQDPNDFHEELFAEMVRYLEQGSPPRLDLLSTVAPHFKDYKQRRNMMDLVTRFLNSYNDFETVSHLLLKIIKSARINDKEAFNQFWSRYQTVIEADTAEVKRNIRGASDYISFMFTNGVYNRNVSYESSLLELLYFYMNNYLHGKKPSFISPQDFTRVIAFLLAFSGPDDPVYKNINYISKIQDFASQLRIADLFLLSRAVNLALLVMTNVGGERKSLRNPKCYEYLLQVCSILEEQTSFKVLDKVNPLHPSEFLHSCRINLNIQKTLSGECSPLFSEAIKLALQHGGDSVDSKFIRDLCSCLLAGNFKYSPAINKVSEFIESSHQFMAPDVAERFVGLAFFCGIDTDDEKTARILTLCGDSIEKHMKRMTPLGILTSALALCFFRILQPKLAHIIFSVEFLDLVDVELKAFSGSGAYQMRLRKAFMELNRAVCIDMPDLNIPWFHQKFCEQLAASDELKKQENTAVIADEVLDILYEIFDVSSGTPVQSQVYSPYYYPIDFLIEFDTKGHPIKKSNPKRKFFDFTPVNTEPDPEVKYKVAILVQSPSSYTKNERSLQGAEKLCQRHLEILGYHVITIDPQHWNSMYMSEPSAKLNYLETKIFEPISSHKKNNNVEESDVRRKINFKNSSPDLPV